MSHVSVLLEPALEFLAIRPDGIYVDATFGAGGHTRAMLERISGTGRVIALDSDPTAEERARALDSSRLTFASANFRRLSDVLDELGVAQVDGVLFDLGVSSMQFDEAYRGFSLSKDGPLDMRMNPHAGKSAYEVLSTASERELADIFFEYGEERSARRIARSIVERRSIGALPTTTTDFAELVAGAVHRPGHRERIHPATRVFQALRIAVNDELDALARRPRFGGRQVARRRPRRRHQFPLARRSHRETDFRDDPRLNVLTKKPLSPDESERAENPRARSAKMRAAERKAG